MTVLVPVKSIKLERGSVMTLNGMSWQEYENILEELGEHRHTIVAYYQGSLEIMSPLSLHELYHRIICDIVKAILDFQGRDWDDFGSSTLYRPEKAGLEPDTCFYITNAPLVRGCTARINTEIYPPPDLAIESDVTSQTRLSAYQAIAVPELWIYGSGRIKIFIFREGNYVESETSPLFPNVPIKTLIPQLVSRALEIGTSFMLREFRQTLQKGELL